MLNLSHDALWLRAMLGTNLKFKILLNATLNLTWLYFFNCLNFSFAYFTLLRRFILNVA
jgi:hypothetical protein